jgi:hypothetical protein
LDNSNPTRDKRGRSLAIALAAAFALALPLPAMAQDAEESPVVDPEPAAQEQAGDAGIPFPVMLGGQLLAPESFAGAEWLELFSGEDADTVFVEGMQELVESAGAALEDFSVKSALYEPETFDPETGEPVPSEPAVVLALRIADTDAREWVERAVDVLVADVSEPGLIMRPFGTKWALRVTDAAMPGVYPRTVYLKDDTAWFIQGDNDYVWDALDQLPGPDPVAVSSADTLFSDVPLALGGERRDELYESTFPLWLPTLGERIGDGVEDWLVDLYLEAGILPTEMRGVIASWGLQSEEGGIQIEGVRLPEGGEELTQRLLEDVFLIRPPEVSVDPESEAVLDIDPVAAALQGVVFNEEEIAGQMVTTLDDGDSLLYIFGSADSIWVISDPLGERAKVEEAIESLP